MDILVQGSQLLLSLSILVILHEFGHYIPAKLFKTRVEKFYLFFNPWFSLFKKKIGDTEWGIGWLPLGGFVKIAGMVDESMDKEQLAQPAQPWEFRSKPAWQRLIIMLGGVTVNLIVGILIYILVTFTYGVETVNPKDLTAGMSVQPYLSKYGINSGDIVTKVDGENVESLIELNKIVFLRGGRKLEVVHPGGKTETITLPEDVDYKIFENGAFPLFSMRAKLNSVKYLFAVDAYADQKVSVNVQDVLYKINGAETSAMEDLDQLIDSQKSTTFITVRGGDTLTNKVPAKLFKDKILPLFPALASGLRSGDKFLAVNGQKVEYFDQVVSEVYKKKGKKVSLTIWRNDKEVELTSAVSKSGMMGFAPNDMQKMDTNAIKTTYYSFGESIGKGLSIGTHTLGDYVSQMKFLFTKKGASSIGGFGSMGKLFPPTWDWQVFWLNTALISIILAFMNILPIPALDGGHVVFLLYEIITGKEAPQKVLEYAQYVGVILLLSLMLYANGSDIYRALFG